MGEFSEISWTDHTFNPWMGCTKVSEACKFCYAERDMDLRYGKVQWGPSGTRVLTSNANWRKPLAWNKKAAAEGRRMRVFCASLADVFEDWTGPIVNSKGESILACDVCGLLHVDDHPHDICPCGRLLQRVEWATMNDVRRRLFALIDSTPWLDWLLLTKRPENIWRMWSLTANSLDSLNVGKKDCRRENVWLGCSVENQQRAEERIPELLKCRDLARVLFLSCEPLLGPLNLGNIATKGGDAFNCLDGLGGPNVDWVIAGGESGPTARPSNAGWFYGLMAQCVDAKVPFHFKQWGEWAPHNLHPAWDLTEDYGVAPKEFGFWTYADAWVPSEGGNPFRQSMVRVGKKAAGRTLDGREWDELPC